MSKHWRRRSGHLFCSRISNSSSSMDEVKRDLEYHIRPVKSLPSSRSYRHKRTHPYPENYRTRLVDVLASDLS